MDFRTLHHAMVLRVGAVRETSVSELAELVSGPIAVHAEMHGADAAAAAVASSFFELLSCAAATSAVSSGSAKKSATNCSAALATAIAAIAAAERLDIPAPATFLPPPTSPSDSVESAGQLNALLEAAGSVAQCLTTHSSGGSSWSGFIVSTCWRDIVAPAAAHLCSAISGAVEGAPTLATTVNNTISSLAALYALSRHAYTADEDHATATGMLTMCSDVCTAWIVSRIRVAVLAPSRQGTAARDVKALLVEDLADAYTNTRRCITKHFGCSGIGRTLSLDVLATALGHLNSPQSCGFVLTNNRNAVDCIAMALAAGELWRGNDGGEADNSPFLSDVEVLMKCSDPRQAHLRSADLSKTPHGIRANTNFVASLAAASSDGASFASSYADAFARGVMRDFFRNPAVKVAEASVVSAFALRVLTNVARSKAAVARREAARSALVSPKRGCRAVFASAARWPQTMSSWSLHDGPVLLPNASPNGPTDAVAAAIAKTAFLSPATRAPVRPLPIPDFSAAVLRDTTEAMRRVLRATTPVTATYEQCAKWHSSTGVLDDNLLGAPRKYVWLPALTTVEVAGGFCSPATAVKLTLLELAALVSTATLIASSPAAADVSLTTLVQLVHKAWEGAAAWVYSSASIQVTDGGAAASDAAAAGRPSRTLAAAALGVDEENEGAVDDQGTTRAESKDALKTVPVVAARDADPPANVSLHGRVALEHVFSAVTSLLARGLMHVTSGNGTIEVRVVAAGAAAPTPAHRGLADLPSTWSGLDVGATYALPFAGGGKRKAKGLGDAATSSTAGNKPEQARREAALVTTLKHGNGWMTVQALAAVISLGEEPTTKVLGGLAARGFCECDSGNANQWRYVA
jgi:hypothetical protein